MEARRAQPRPTTCVCRLKVPRIEVNIGNGQTVTTGGHHDSCMAATSGPDEPVCLNCTRAGHPESPGFDPTIKDPVIR